ncbi:hypothetical protein EHQ46_16105 [Leptospira yanagawae]|uniref:Uncharacterized protein n=1 Tax=Leptospira yanagawae TaxID=293069 RepID=A0ABY2LY56_9LEPT|nr:hypothetical protein [Leptospira yanagawae]TGL17710.1 hypothetical protein EHQ46_16105 [Leptospira yanagawae]
MATGTLTDTVYKLTPNLGNNGTWNTLISSDTISRKVDMGGCSLNGSFYFLGGRTFSSGLIQSSNDAYIPSSNSISSLSGASLFIGRHGFVTACYSPKTTDPFASEPVALISAGEIKKSR